VEGGIEDCAVLPAAPDAAPPGAGRDPDACGWRGPGRADLVALADAGFTVTPVKDASDLGEVFYGFDQEMAEYEVSDAVHAIRLQLVRFDRSRPAVMMDIGPVLHPR
jgi:hypothetical protein